MINQFAVLVTSTAQVKLVVQVNADKFALVRKGFDQLGFASDELDSIYSIMAAIIHLGDIELVPAGPGDDNTDRCRIANPDQVKIGT